MTSAADALGHVTTSAYDNIGRLKTVTLPDPDGAGALAAPVTTYVYDALGRTTHVIDALGGDWLFVYDDVGRLTNRVDPLGHTVTDTFDAAGHLLSVRDPLEQVTSSAYDAAGRRTTITDPLAGVTHFAYDAVGNLTGLTDPVGNHTTFAYDSLNRQITDTDALAHSRHFTYDAAGNRISETDRNGRVRQFDSEFAYDGNANYRPIDEKWMDGETTLRTIASTYTAAGLLQSIGDSDSAYSYTYDTLGRMTSVSNAGTPGAPTVVLNATYDNLNRRTSVSATINGTADFVTAYTYDILSRTTRITQTGAAGGNTVADKRIDLAYNAVGAFDSITRFANLAGAQPVATSAYAYDNADRLTGLTHAHGSTTITAYAWTFDPASRITSFTSPDGTSTYSYDATSQLTAADHSAQTDEAYQYDANGNRTNTGFTTGPNNQILSDGTYSYTYDGEGNRTSRAKIGTSEVTTYSWDHRNRLIAVSTIGAASGNGTITYTYDVFDRLIEKKVTLAGTVTATEHFGYDGAQIVLVTDGTGSLTHRFLYGPAIDQVFADETALGEVLWPLTDNQGTVRDVITSSGGANHLTYDTFGKILDQSNATYQPFQAFAGYVYDGDIGTYYVRERWYDPALQTFISFDPLSFLAGDTNLRRYVGNSPTNFTDPFGLFPGGQNVVPPPTVRQSPNQRPNPQGVNGQGPATNPGPAGTGPWSTPDRMPSSNTVTREEMDAWIAAQARKRQWDEYVREERERANRVREEFERNPACFFPTSVPSRAQFLTGRVGNRTSSNAPTIPRIVRGTNPSRVTFDGFEVRAVRNLSHLNEGTLRFMQQRGVAARDINGQPLELHHLNQNPAGPLVEIPKPQHSIGNRVQHPMGNQPGAGLTIEQRASFNEWRTRYWQERATEELARRGLQ